MSWAEISDFLDKYLPMFLHGAGTTLLISIIGTLIGSLIGLLIGTARTIPIPERGAKRIFLKIINVILTIYVEFFRGTPMIVQAMVIYYGTALLFQGMEINRILAAIFIVSINTGAYTTEIVRGGIISIDKGQFEAAHAIGMNHAKTMLNVVLPQVLRNILPPLANEFVINIKDTSVLNVISVSELFFETKSVAGATFDYVTPFFVTCIIYLIMTLTVTQILRFIERKLEGPENFVVIPGNQMQVKRPKGSIDR